MEKEQEPHGDVGFLGPWIGEFGWELMSWQGWCRRIAKNFNKVYACSFPDMEYLYKDFATFIPHKHPKRQLDWKDVTQVEIELPNDVTQQVVPFKQYRVKEQSFVKFGWPGDREHLAKSDILIHARGINKGGKNYPIERWEVLVEKINETLESFGVVASIGSTSDMHIKGTTDCRGMALEALCNYISQARMIVGQSSGVMHLASLCGTPHIVWGDSRTYFGETLEQRYKTTWNPFHTPSHFIFDDNWDPNPEIVVQHLQMFDPLMQQKAEIAQKAALEQVATPPNPVYLPLELKNKLRRAIVSGRYFTTISWKEKDDTIEHFRFSRNFPNGDYIPSLEHLIQEIYNNIPVRKEEVKRESREDDFQEGLLGWV